MISKKKAILITVLAILALMAAGCGQDPAKMPGDQLLQKAFESVHKTAGAFEGKEVIVIPDGSGTIKMNADGILAAGGEKYYSKTKDFPEAGMQIETYYEDNEKNIYMRLGNAGATVLTKVPKDVSNEFIFGYATKFIRALQDPKNLVNLKVVADKDQLIVTAGLNPDTMNYLQLKTAELRYFIDRKMLTLQKIETSIANTSGAQVTGAYLYRPGLAVPALTKEEKAQAVAQ